MQGMVIRIRRPHQALAVVVSADTFTERTGLCLCCPVVSGQDGFPLHVPLQGVPGVSGMALIEQLQSVDLRMRQYETLGRLPPDLVLRIGNLARLCLAT